MTSITVWRDVNAVKLEHGRWVNAVAVQLPSIMFGRSWDEDIIYTAEDHYYRDMTRFVGFDMSDVNLDAPVTGK